MSQGEEGPLYLGLDLSTQQLKAILVQSDLHVVSEVKVDFDADFGSKYKIRKGVLVNEAENGVFAPVALWLESIDLVLARLRDATPGGLGRIRGISGSCQQHGSTYWSRDAESLLAGLKWDEKEPKGLVDQLTDAFSHPFAPNWQDGSTQAQCDRFDAALGSAHRLAEVTGSSAHHRFTGTQIMRLREKLPEMYAATSRISLVSSFLASIFLGSIAPLDIGDVGGMNLWDIQAKAWSEPLLALAAGGESEAAGLRQRLGEPRLDGGGSMGAIAPYFRARYGFHPDCQIAPFTGDNPATILALPLRPLDAIVSLGTSSTFLMITPVYQPDESYHFMNHPCTPGQYMFMLCYKNGGLARETVRDRLPKPQGPDSTPWDEFNKCVLDTPALDLPVDNEGNPVGADPKAKMGLYFNRPEIVPNIRAGTWRYTVAPSGDLSTLQESKEPWDPKVDPRILVESQGLSMRLRSQALVEPRGASSSSADDDKPTLPAQPRRIYLVGGGSLNPAIAQVLGSVLGGAEGVYRLDVGGNACALGGAYKAVWALERRDENETFDDLIGKRWRGDEAVEKVDVGYRPGVFERYGKVVGAFEEMEKRILEVAKN
ncbi:D-xylulose kinase [Sodiomyces alkalinus F11]|uniref:Xylulose kinase n=1 Tax=Sodiomyces alkalinus (strain CBS 110278 / VKM F-3762 / F11) TaxID=1314773 RepID=A0A3N2PMY5_SODAK|nr:D-xylulose kinase [Sodiomyces alkalinus F11]ROT35892.1 D-xylulose kinase [Sodiomyces alkalinus F11]